MAQQQSPVLKTPRSTCPYEFDMLVKQWSLVWQSEGCMPAHIIYAPDPVSTQLLKEGHLRLVSLLKRQD